jgi:Zn-dependent peptidase ImmA (M78 family)
MQTRRNSVRRKLISNVVQDVLLNSGVDRAPVDVNRIARKLDISIRKSEMEGDVDGFVVTNVEGYKAVIGVNTSKHPNRQRFTVAHELGHALLHSGEKLHVDQGFEIKLRSSKPVGGYDLDEKEANLFAAELLMPERLLERDLAEIGRIDLEDQQSISELARRYRVSTQAMSIRLGYLRYLDL